jgi:hypothetical protein
MGITFDETLARALYDRLIINGRWTAMQYGDDTDAGSKHVAYAMWHNGRETAKLNRRAEEYGQALNEFLDEVRSWLEEEPGAAS